MKHKIFNTDFWKKERTPKEWESILESSNTVSLLISYFERDYRFNRIFSELAIKKHDKLYSQFSKYFINPSYTNHLNWLSKSHEYSSLLQDINEVFLLRKKKIALISQWFSELSHLAFDEVLYYFSAVHRANGNLQKTLSTQGANGIFDLLISEFSSYYIEQTLAKNEIWYKWDQDQTPEWHFREQHEGGFGYDDKSNTYEYLTQFRIRIETAFVEYLQIESKLTQIIFDVHLDSDNFNSESKNEDQTIQLINSRADLVWLAIAHGQCNGLPMDEDHLYNFIYWAKKDRDLFQKSVEATLILQSFPEIIRIKDEIQIDLVKWTIALSEFVIFQFPTLLPRMDFMGRNIEKRKNNFIEFFSTHRWKSFNRINRTELINIFTNYYKFNYEEVELVIDAMTYRIIPNSKYDIRISPFFAINDEELIYSLQSLNRINWSHQLVTSL